MGAACVHLVSCERKCSDADGTGAHAGAELAPGLHQPWLTGVVAARLVARVVSRRPLGLGRLLLTLEPLQVGRACCSACVCGVLLARVVCTRSSWTRRAL